jgi:hypothetical protein
MKNGARRKKIMRRKRNREKTKVGKWIIKGKRCRKRKINVKRMLWALGYGFGLIYESILIGNNMIVF